jgi:hypothetical protein
VVAGRTNRVLSSTDLTAPSWPDISGALTGVSGDLTFTDTAATGARKFYRVQIAAPQNSRERTVSAGRRSLTSRIAGRRENAPGLLIPGGAVRLCRDEWPCAQAFRRRYSARKMSAIAASSP